MTFFFQLFRLKPSHGSRRDFAQVFIRPGIGPIDFGVRMKRNQSLDQVSQLSDRVRRKMAEGVERNFHFDTKTTHHQYRTVTARPHPQCDILN